MEKSNKSIKIIIALIFLIILVLIALVVLNSFGIFNKEISVVSYENNQEDEEKRIQISETLSYSYDKASGGYLIYDENDIPIYFVLDEEGLGFYIDNPDFNPNDGVYQESVYSDEDDEIMQ